MDNKKKIVLCGGGTAGHVYPALAVAEKLKGYEIHFFGGNGMEKEILKGYKNIIYHEIPTVKFERKLTLKNLFIPVKLIKSIKFTKKELKKVSPCVIFSKGGFVSVPVAMAGSKLKIPIISHESDLSFGLANKIILRKCVCMCTTFSPTGVSNKKCVHTGQPIRQEILNGKKLNLHFSNNKPTLLVLGGSLGARFLNNLVIENLEQLLKEYNVIHICGEKNYKNIKQNIEQNIQQKTLSNYSIHPFVENIQDYYVTANFVISRAGSGVINELLALEKPMLLIPLTKANSRGDQIENAKFLKEKGLCEVLTEEECTFENLAQNLDKLQKNAEKIKKNIKKYAKNNATDQICELIKKYSI